MAQSKKLKDGSYIDASGVWDNNLKLSQEAVNTSKFDKAGGTITGDVVFSKALNNKAISGVANTNFFILPNYSFLILGTTVGDSTAYYKALLKRLCVDFPNIKTGMWIGSGWASTRDIVIIYIYDTGEKDSTGLPRYARVLSFGVTAHNGKSYLNDNYVWSEKSFSFT